jgi:hypothetical protein
MRQLIHFDRWQSYTWAFLGLVVGSALLIWVWASAPDAAVWSTIRRDAGVAFVVFGLVTISFEYAVRNDLAKSTEGAIQTVNGTLEAAIKSIYGDPFYRVIHDLIIRRTFSRHDVTCRMDVREAPDDPDYVVLGISFEYTVENETNQTASYTMSVEQDVRNYDLVRSLQLQKPEFIWNKSSVTYNEKRLDDQTIQFYRAEPIGPRESASFRANWAHVANVEDKYHFFLSYVSSRITFDISHSRDFKVDVIMLGDERRGLERRQTGAESSEWFADQAYPPGQAFVVSWRRAVEARIDGTVTGDPQGPRRALDVQALRKVVRASKQHEDTVIMLLNQSIHRQFKQIPNVDPLEYLTYLNSAVSRSKRFQAVQRYPVSWFKRAGGQEYLRTLQESGVEEKFRIFIVDDAEAMLRELREEGLMQFYWQYSGGTRPVYSYWTDTGTYKDFYRADSVPDDFALYDSLLLIRYDESQRRLSFDLVDQDSRERQVFDRLKDQLDSTNHLKYVDPKLTPFREIPQNGVRS